jgi:AraC family transcriptional regulator
MPDVTLIAQAVDFIEENLQEPIGVAEMADAVGYSLYHFCRTFNQVTHHTPYDYLMRRRLAEAAQRLLQGDERIVDVAFAYQFNSHETFSRAFKRVFGMQPSQLREQGRIDRPGPMPRLTSAHLQQINKGAYLKPALVETDAFQVAGFMTLVREGQTIVSELWSLLAEELKRHASTAGAESYYGVVWYPGQWEDRGFLYMAAFRIEEPDAAGPALVLQAIPALTCARFLHKGPVRDLPLTLDYVVHTWLPKSGRQLSQPLVLEHYGQGYHGVDDDDFEVEVYLPIQ